MDLILLAAGLVALLVGGELLVRGASRLAALIGISPLIVGLTVVSFGTSAPELAVSLQAAFSGFAGLTVGNIIGSNIYNVLLVLGAAAIIAPLLVQQQLIRLDVPLMIGASLVFWAVALDGVVTFTEGGLMFGLLLVYLVFVWRVSRRERADVVAEYAGEFGYRAAPGWRPKLINMALVGGGVLLLVAGAGWLVDGAVSLASALGVSDLVIGLTIVAIGTSLPELTTSLVAAFRGERDIAVGNVVGSNIFNILSVLALTALVAPAGVAVSPVALEVDLPFMVAVAIACLPLFVTGRIIARREGAFLLAYGLIYTAFVALTAYGAGLPPFTFLGLLVIAPLSMLVLVPALRRRVSGGRAAR
ncbi:MAG TPA: calcium/sodium antiporter [Candidatus Limnocylindrales bacterium]|nr:calcium/sodium antiporter [Candidatus Limnocylindrales bacterium]